MMKNSILYKFSLFTSFFAVAVCVVAVIVSYRAHNASKQLQKEYRYEMETLRREITKLKKDLIASTNKIAQTRAQSTETTSHQSSDTKQTTDKTALEKTSVLQKEALTRLQQIIESTGLDQLAMEENIDPDILREIYDQYAERKQVASHRQHLLERNNQLLSDDAKQYDEEVNTLYQQAHLRRRRDLFDKEYEKAFKQMVEKYPDAYATAMVIADRALFSAWNRNTADVEKYYDMLQGSTNENFLKVVTERGVEAVPNIEHYLVRQYMREGRNEEAAYFIESLERNYPENLLFVRRPGSRPGWESVSQVVPILKQQNKLSR